MKLKYLFLGLAMSSLFLLSTCDRPPELPLAPEISFEDVEFIEGVSSDSLLVTVYFKDGDGDLGLTREDIMPPFNEKYYFKDQNGNYIKYGMSDTLPPFELPYSCIQYSVENVSQTQVIETDTFYIMLNDNYYNIFVKFFKKQNDGSYEEFDWRTYSSSGGGACFNYNGRFPMLNSSGGKKPLEGSLRYGMVSVGFESLFANDTLQLEVQIQDRSLNKSNIIRTPDFTIAGLKAGRE